VFVQPVVAVGPDLPVALDPADGLVEALRLQDAGPRLSCAGPRDEAGLLQHLQVFRDRLLRHRERLGELVHRRVAAGEPFQDRAPGGVGQGRENQGQVVFQDRHVPTLSTTLKLHNLRVVDRGATPS